MVGTGCAPIPYNGNEFLGSNLGTTLSLANFYKEPPELTTNRIPAKQKQKDDPPFYSIRAVGCFVEDFQQTFNLGTQTAGTTPVGTCTDYHKASTYGRPFLQQTFTKILGQDDFL
jgi:hypothetical protein